MKIIFKLLMLLPFILLSTYSHTYSQAINNGFSLENYQLDYNTTITGIAADLSGVTYNPLTNTLFMVTNTYNPNNPSNSSRIYETHLNGQIIRFADLVDYALDNNNRRHDPEDIVHISGNLYAVAEERLGRIVYIRIDELGDDINLRDSTYTQLPGTWNSEDGVEGVSYNPGTGDIYCVVEAPMELHRFDISELNPFSTITNCNLYGFNPPITDVSAVHHLQLTGSTGGQGFDNHTLILSEESNVLIEADDNCSEKSRLNVPGTQLEGVTMDYNGNIYIVGEDNEFYVYKPTINLCRYNDSLALVAFYNQMDVNYWSDAWDLAQPMDTWSGIILNESGCVSNIYFYGNKLKGTLAPELGNLSHLVSLGISSHNELTGSIPPELGNLNNLERLDISNLQLGGSIPPELGNLSNLERLDITFNLQLGGSIPPELGNLTNLKYLSLYFNQLTGSIPPELGNLSNLTELKLEENQLTGSIPSQLGNLNNLQSLSLRSNQLSGAIPSQLGNMSSLITLSLNNNQLSGSIPPQLSNLTNLGILSLRNNQLNGSIPSELGNSSNLFEMYLSYNQLSGTIPPEIGGLSTLREFRVDNNQLSGCYSSELNTLCDQLFISRNEDISDGNNFDANWEDFCDNGEGACITDCRQSDSLSLVAFYNQMDVNYWSDAWDLAQPMDTWSGITLNESGCVSDIVIYGNKLKGTLAPELGNLSHLINLEISGHDELVGTIPPEIGNLSNLEKLVFGFNPQLGGTIPPELGNLSNLKDLRLHVTQLTGSIPPELGNLDQVTWFMLGNNQLTGSIPAELGNLDNVQYLYLWDNQLSGSIPPELGNLSSLFGMYLSYNQLSGNIPPELGNLSNLTQLYLEHNQLSGGIPAELSNLANLSTLRVAYNQMSGCYPNELNILCNQLISGNGDISDGNNFDIEWEDFCVGDAITCPDCRQSDSLALVDFYNALNPGSFNQWDLAQPMDTWTGVTLNDNGCVTVLNLNEWDINGTISPSLGNLSELVTLNLLDNWLTGTIPSELGNLTNLTSLSLGFNQLSGSIPPELGNLNNLTYIGLYRNELTGSIPSELGNLNNLQYLFLYDNQLSGPIPAQLGNMNSMTIMRLSDNQLNGTIPSNFSNLGNLNILELRNNQLSGSIPAQLSDLTNLTQLSLHNNQLSGTIPPELGNLSNLTSLYLHENQLTGSIPAELGSLSALGYFKVHHNQMSGCYPNELNTLCNQLYLSRNEDISDGNNFDIDWEDFCVGDVLPCLDCRQSDSLTLVILYNATNGDNWTNSWDLTQPMDTWYKVTLNAEGCVTHLNLYNNQLSGTIPPEIGDLNKLERLSLYNNQLTGAIPPELGNLNNLNFLNLYNNQLTGNIPSEIGGLNSLEVLNIKSNQLSGNIPPEIGNLSNLRGIELSNNQLSGSIPPEIGNLNLQGGLNLTDNQLTGSIPPEIGNLSNLQTLNLDKNQLSGSIPSELSNLDNIEYLRLTVNNLTGNIPPELATLNNLRGLYLYNNQLSGAIPPQLGNLTMLDYLQLHNNQLSGNIPAELGNLSNLITLQLSNNQLSGNIPAQLGDMNALRVLKLQDNQLAGCYSNELNALCNQLYSSTNEDISDGNNFEIPWEDFCTGDALSDCGGVWPGDFNYDGEANTLDVLFWGLAEGNSSPLRDGATTEWLAQPCNDADSTVNNINNKHQDGDGNGIIDTMDLEVLIENYDTTHSHRSPIDYVSGSMEYELKLLSNNSEGIDIDLTYGLLIKDTVDPLNIHGFACTAYMSGSSYGTIQLNYSENSPLAPEVIFIRHQADNIKNAAFTRINRENCTTCDNTHIAEVRIVVVTKDIPEFVEINEGSAIDADGNIHIIPEIRLLQSEILADAGINREDESQQGGYLLQNYPNPFSTNTTIQYYITEDVTEAAIQVIDLTGRVVHTNSIDHTGNGEIQINTETLPSGIYNYLLITNQGISDTKKMVILK